MEWLTNRMEEEAYRYFDEIEKMGGILEAVKAGYIQKEIAATSYRRQIRLEEGKEVMVGVNKYTEKEEQPLNILKISKAAQKQQLDRIKAVRKSRDENDVRNALDQLEEAMRKDDVNTMPYILKAVEAYATIEEISNVGRKVFGTWKEPVIV